MEIVPLLISPVECGPCGLAVRWEMKDAAREHGETAVITGISV